MADMIVHGFAKEENWEATNNLGGFRMEKDDQHRDLIKREGKGTF